MSSSSLFLSPSQLPLSIQAQLQLLAEPLWRRWRVERDLTNAAAHGRRRGTVWAGDAGDVVADGTTPVEVPVMVVAAEAKVCH